MHESVKHMKDGDAGTQIFSSKYEPVGFNMGDARTFALTHPTLSLSLEIINTISLEYYYVQYNRQGFHHTHVTHEEKSATTNLTESFSASMACERQNMVPSTNSTLSLDRATPQAAHLRQRR